MAIPPPDDGYGDAAVSPWTTRVVAFTRWVGPGRRVTQTGAAAPGAGPRTRAGARHRGCHRSGGPRAGAPHHQQRRTPRAEHHLCVGQGGAAGAGHRRQAGRGAEERCAAGAAGAAVGADVRHVRGHSGRRSASLGGASRCCVATSLRHPGRLSGVCEHDGPAGLDLVCRWGRGQSRWPGRWRPGHPPGHVAAVNDRDVRAAVGVLARFGALRLDGLPDARVVALTPLGRAAMPSCW